MLDGFPGQGPTALVTVFKLVEALHESSRMTSVKVLEDMPSRIFEYEMLDPAVRFLAVCSRTGFGQRFVGREAKERARTEFSRNEEE